MGDRQWSHPLIWFDEQGFPFLLPDIAPSPRTCRDCGETVFPGATICDSCGTPQHVESTREAS